ncbi:MAG: hypothetical protein O3A00_10640 [Planctomycetota bacterium]|nr:hypothetical protein [Planctomycetota bacterium]
MRILYWNIDKKNRTDLIIEAMIEVSADVLVLLENGARREDTLAALQNRASAEFHMPRCAETRFQVYSRVQSFDLSEVYGGNRLSLRRLRFGNEQLLLGVVHVVEKRNWDELQQAAEVQLLASEICRHEDRIGHTRTILIGDFNMNPFDPIMNLAPGLNAMMTEACTARRERTVQGSQYRFFYNPMWGSFGDRTDGPAGTYYNRSSSKGMYGWNIFDQVLVRPDAVKRFDNVSILSAFGSTSLETSGGRPNRSLASDHFPILLSLR